MKIMTYFPKIFLIIFFVIFQVPASAQPPHDTEDKLNDKFSSQSKAPHGKMRVGQYNILLDDIRSQQSVKVIIQLQSPNVFSIEKPGLSIASTVKARELEIKKYQDAFISQKGWQQNNKIKQFKHIPFLSLDIDEALLEELMQSEEVLSISKDTLNRISLDASIPYIAANSLWSEGYTGSNQAIAILDTGVDSGHIFFADPVTGSKVISEACYSTTYGPLSATSLCVDGSTLPGAGSNCTGYNGCFHGTHVAGIAAGDGGDFSGVAKDASLIAIQVFSGFNNPDFCGTSTCIAAFTSDIIQGLERVYTLASEGTYSIASVNLSLGGGGFSSVSECDAGNLATKQIIDDLRSIGIATVIASGNEAFLDTISVPGCISSAISVGATDNSDKVAGFSNSASWLTLLAPGVNITSSVPNDAFSSHSGTSMATPHVAGAFALLKSKLPSATVDQLLAAMVNTGRLTTDSGNGLVIPRIKLDSASEALGFGSLPVNIILDNDFDGTQVQGEFGRVINTQSYNGSALEGRGAGSNIFRFTPSFPQSGDYRVYGWWPAAANNSNDAVFTIKHDDGETQINVNQQIDGSQWYELGIFSFSPDNLAYVEVSDINTPTIIADAVRFEFLPITLQLTIETNILPAGSVSVAYTYSLSAISGLSPYTWNIIDGSLPSGLALQADGIISGVPSQAESSNFTVQVTDNSGNIAIQVLSLTIGSGSGSNSVFDDNFEGGILAPWSQLQSGSVQLINDPVYGGILRKLSNNDPNGGWAPLGEALSDFDLVLYTRKPNAIGGNSIRYSLTDASGNGYGVRLTNPSGTLSIEKRSAWKGSSISGNASLPGGLLLDQWYTVHLLRQNSTLSAAVYIGRVDPVLATPVIELNTSHSAYNLFNQVNINGGYDFDTDNVRIVDLAVIASLSLETSTLNNGIVNTLYNAGLVVSGGVSPYTWSIASGTLPAGLSLQTDGTISGTPSQVETSNFMVQVTDNAGSIVTQTLSLAITPPLLNVDTNILVNGVIDSAYNVALVASGGSLPYAWSVVTGALPTGLSLQADGTFSGFPSQLGTNDFIVQVTDNSGSTATQTLSLTISPDSGANSVFEDNFESGTLAPWSQLQSGSVQLINDSVDGGFLRKISNNDPNGGWVPLGETLNNFELVLHTRKPNAAGGNAIRYSLTDTDGNGYGIKLTVPSGTFSIEKRKNWQGSSIGNGVSLPSVEFNQWYTLRFSRQGDTLNASIYMGQVVPALETPLIELSITSSTYNSFDQLNINGGYDFDTDNVRIY